MRYYINMYEQILHIGRWKTLTPQVLFSAPWPLLRLPRRVSGMMANVGNKILNFLSGMMANVGNKILGDKKFIKADRISNIIIILSWFWAFFSHFFQFYGSCLKLCVIVGFFFFLFFTVIVTFTPIFCRNFIRLPPPPRCDRALVELRATFGTNCCASATINRRQVGGGGGKIGNLLYKLAQNQLCWLVVDTYVSMWEGVLTGT